MSARILVVDDVIPNLRLLEAKLSAEYYEVQTAQDGVAALAIARDWLPDLILLDVMMPGMDGFEVCRRLKADPATEHVPVVMVTALGETAERVRGLEAGADDFLTKPVDDETLFARVRALVRLKRLLDEWRLRSETTHQLGVQPESQTLPSVRGCRALLVDDTDLDAERILEALDAEGIRCDRAASPAEAVERLAAAPYDLVVLDLQLAGEDPLRLTSRLRADGATRETPVLMVAEADLRRQLHRGLDLGANDYILRPIDPNELRARARNQIRRKLYQDRLRADLAYSISLALTDPLTGLHNQRYLRGHLRSLVASVRASGGSLAAMMLDLDHFKAINDLYGHPAGDAALRAVAGCIRAHVRLFDTVSRYGGEEFAVVMPGATLADAVAAAERLRREVATLAYQPAAADRHPLTISIGVSALTADACGTDEALAEGLLKRADQALYEAKRQGRNRVVALEVDGEVVPAG
ncbi:PleD family two-component system response regulator [Elioraea tepidiphila]|uniref:PleD family two-component system response regulator n=1 Tax=Elioraea tepidiphila TaxID=457934 RepID=UPI00035D0E36|nr:PleD family two-component system response regulator [Elioraea tepidiphila]